MILIWHKAYVLCDLLVCAHQIQIPLSLKSKVCVYVRLYCLICTTSIYQLGNFEFHFNHLILDILSCLCLIVKLQLFLFALTAEKYKEHLNLISHFKLELFNNLEIYSSNCDPNFKFILFLL